MVSQHALQQVSREGVLSQHALQGGIPVCLAAGLWGGAAPGGGSAPVESAPGGGGLCGLLVWCLLIEGGLLVESGLLLWPSGMAFWLKVVFCYGLQVWPSGKAFWYGGVS